MCEIVPVTSQLTTTVEVRRLDWISAKRSMYYSVASDARVVSARRVYVVGSIARKPKLGYRGNSGEQGKLRNAFLETGIHT